ncbi:sigma-54 interaction domain-containing protein [Desulfobacter latus]|uniref:Sigma 54-interacting transcriptional regulator n=1 Tax=Desulfobacter latus TaxID=2292 RepID=A0A850SUE9_9BACT|nr:sigma 54-interacting transcriptional regulator [Desulfobacter latus]NWH03640.1 sigma 54-interacting transcriptional regulator [Desulfobacter latus]
MLEYTPIAQFAIGNDHKVKVWNRAFEVLSGVSAEDIIDTDHQWKIFYSSKRPVLADLVVEQDYEKFLEIYGTKNPAQSSIVPNAWEATDYFENINGRPRYINFLAAPVFDHAGNITGAVTTLQDITHGKIQEDAVRRESEQLQQQYSLFQSSMGERFTFCNIIGKSRKMREVYDMIARAAAVADSVVIHGESGVGKELVARTIHNLSQRKNAPFLSVNCDAPSESLLEIEFFGHVKGAFRGACNDKKGVLCHVQGGTLFLHDVGKLSLNLQVKLLRVMEGGGYSPVGSNEVLYSDFRIVAASTWNLWEEVQKGRLRSDFFYRLYVIPIDIPPLRERKEDLALLADYFLSRMKSSLHFYALPEKDIQALYNYHWPGNVRELQNVLRRYIGLQGLDAIAPPNIPLPEIPPARPSGVIAVSDSGTDLPLTDAVARFEKQFILSALELSRWHRGKAAEKLGISRKTLYRKMGAYGIDLP